MSKKKLLPITYYLLLVIVINSCIASKIGSAKRGENLSMQITEKKDVVNFAALKEQVAPSLASRGSNSRGGILTLSPATGSLLSLATDAIKKVISTEKNKYTAGYQFGLTDLVFYDQLSNEGPFDPAGMQFKGFRVVRTFKNKEGNIDTAFTASFALDTTNVYEILNNSLFRLKVQDFQFHYAKAKIASTHKMKLNIDIDISFQTSYVTPDGTLNANITLGKFYLFVRDAPLDSNASNYHSFYNGLKGKSLTGKSFIVPRSFGYHIENGSPTPGYSQGAYSINVNVKESSKDVFVSKVLLENTNLIIDATRKNVERELNKKLPKNVQ